MTKASALAKWATDHNAKVCARLDGLGADSLNAKTLTNLPDETVAEEVTCSKEKGVVLEAAAALTGAK